MGVRVRARGSWSEVVTSALVNRATRWLGLEILLPRRLAEYLA